MVCLKLALTCIPIEESLRRGTGSVLGSSIALPAFTCSFCSRDESDESTTAAGAGVSWCPSTGRWLREPFVRLLSDELPLVWLLRSMLSRKPSCADSVLLCTVTEIKGLELELRGGTGGGAIFLHVVMHVETTWKSVKGKHYYNTYDYTHKKVVHIFMLVIIFCFYIYLFVKFTKLHMHLNVEDAYWVTTAIWSVVIQHTHNAMCYNVISREDTEPN